MKYRFQSLMMLGLIGAASIGATMPAFGHQAAVLEERSIAARPSSQKRKAAAASAPKWRRARGLQAKPKRRPNRVTVSRRVRRRHRRARKAA